MMGGHRTRRGPEVHDRPLFFSGLMFLVIGLAAGLIARTYPLGSASNMGPGYFPILMSIVLCVIGAMSMVRSLASSDDHGLAAWPIGPAVSIAFGVVAFGLTVERFGLIISSVLLLACVGFSQARKRPFEYLALVVALLIFASLLFVELLSLPIKIGP